MAQTDPQGQGIGSLVEELSKIKPDYARQLWKFAAGLPPKGHIHLIRRKRELYHQKGQDWNRAHPRREQEIELACLLLAMRELYLADKSLKHKDRRGRQEILDADRMISEIRIQRVREEKKERKRRSSPVRNTVERHLHVILDLRKKGCSWREVQAILKELIKKDISYVYLQKCVEELAAGLTLEQLDGAAEVLADPALDEPDPQPPR